MKNKWLLFWIVFNIGIAFWHLDYISLVNTFCAGALSMILLIKRLEEQSLAWRER